MHVSLGNPVFFIWRTTVAALQMSDSPCVLALLAVRPMLHISWSHAAFLMDLLRLGLPFSRIYINSVIDGNDQKQRHVFYLLYV